MTYDPTLPIEMASMPGHEWYTDNQFYQKDIFEILPSHWQPVLRTSELEKKNSFVTGNFFGVPYIITKDENEKVRAFENICRHKAREVETCRSSQCKKELICGYHGWKYNLSGELVSAPGIGGVKNFDKKEFGLKEIQIEKWGHWFFINLSQNAPSMEKKYSHLDHLLRDRDWENLKFYQKKEWEINCNWKVYIDNYLDGGYHIPHMHPSLNEQIQMKNYKTEIFEDYNIQSAQALDNTNTQNSLLEVSPSERIGKGSLYAWIFPNFMINLYGNCLDTNYVIPLSPSKCLVKYEFYFQDSVSEDFKKLSIKQSDITQIEDIEICESVQTGLASKRYIPGRYAPQYEIGEYQFHQILNNYY